MMEGDENIEDVLALLLYKESVEIKMEDNGFYEGFVESLEKYGVLVSFKNKWCPDMFVPFEDVRCQRGEPISELNVQVGMVAEEYGANDKYLANAYWKCVVKSIHGSVCGIQYVDRVSRKDVCCVVPLKHLRKPNLKPVFNENEFEVTCVLIKEAYEYYINPKEVMKYLKKYCGGAIVSYDIIYHTIFIESPFPKHAKYITYLIKDYLDNLYEYIDKYFESLDLERSIIIEREAGFTGQIRVEKHVLKYVVGPDENILEHINEMNGISFLKYNQEKERFLVFGNTNEIVIQALKLLDYKRDYIYLSPSELSTICGNPEDLEEMKQCCNLTDFYVSDNPVLEDIPAYEDKSVVIFVGSAENVCSSKTYLSVLVCYVRQGEHAYNNNWYEFEKNVLEARELAKSINLFPNGFADESKLHGTNHYPLNIWMTRVGCRGLLVLDVFLEEQLQKHPISPELSQLISTIYNQLKSIYGLKTPLKQFENESDWSSYTKNLTKILYDLGCPETLILSGPVKRRLNCKWQKMIAVKFLVSELLCAQLTNNTMELKDLKKYLIISGKEVTGSSILDYFWLPSRPSDKAMKRLIRKLNSM